MKLDKGLKIALIILLIVLISIISFVGIFVQEKGQMENIIAKYKLGMDFEGSRVVTTAVSDKTTTVYYDKDGKVVQEEAKGGSKKQEPVNKKESLTQENYLLTKRIIEKRLNAFGLPEYVIRMDENTGKLTIQVPEDNSTDLAIQYIYSPGKFTVVGENNEILLDNSNIKEVNAGYATVQNGTSVYLNIQFNKDCIEKIREISNTYVASTDEEGKDTTKKITMMLDGAELVSTSFGEEVSDGRLSIEIGKASQDTETINAYLSEASNLAILLDNGAFPLQYELEQNRYIQSDIQEKDIVTIGLIIGAVILVGILVLSVIYKKNGIIVGIANIGYIAVLLLIIRYTNVIITIEGFSGLLISIVLNYIFSIYLLKTLKDVNARPAYTKVILRMLFVIIPASIVAITLCFTNWMAMYSFGQVIFWGILTIFMYNTILTRTLLINVNEVKNI